MRRWLILGSISLALGGFAGGLWTGLVLQVPAEVCTQELPDAQVETDLTFKVTPEPPNPRSRGENPDFL